MKLGRECKKCGDDSWYKRKDRGKIKYTCKPCKKIRDKIYRSAHKEEAKAYNKKWVAQNRTKSNAIKRRWADNNKDYINKWYREYNARTGKGAADAAKRRAAIRQAIPIWVDMEIVEDFYSEAKYHQMDIDHMVPLISEKVCGLHWEGNMQLLIPKENSSKGNKYWPDMWEYN